MHHQTIQRVKHLFLYNNSHKHKKVDKPNYYKLCNYQFLYNTLNNQNYILNTNGKITVTKKNLSLPSILKFIGTTTADLEDEDTTNPIIVDGEIVTAVSGNVVILSGTDQEFLWTGSKWEDFGNGSGHSIKGHTHTVTHKPAGSISEVAITPAGSVSQPTFTGTAASHKHTFTGTEATISVTHKPAGSVTISTAAPTSGQTATYTPAGTVSKPTFTGTEATISSSFTPAGTVSKPTFTGSAATS